AGTTDVLSKSAAADGSPGSTPAALAASAYTSVVSTNPSGTAKLARTSSPRLAAFPPTRSTSAADTSARRRTRGSKRALYTRRGRAIHNGYRYDDDTDYGRYVGRGRGDGSDALPHGGD